MTEIPMPNPNGVPLGAPQQTMPPLGLLQPCPIMPFVGTAEAPDGAKFVLARYETPIGSNGFLLTPDDAIAHGEALIKWGKMQKSPLTLPPNVNL